jgi:hypothetical protein
VLSAFPKEAVADSAEKIPLPADLALVPANGPGFLTFRVADLWSGPLVRTLREKMAADNPDLAEGLTKEFPKSFQQLTGVALAEVERLTFVAPDNFLGVTQYAFMIVATNQPLKRDSVIRALGAEERVEGGITIHRGSTGLHRQIGGTKYNQGRGGVRLQFVNDRTFVIVTPEYPPPPAPAASAANPLKEALRLAAGNHAVVGGLIPSACLEQYEGVGAFQNPILSLALLTHPLALARNVAFTLDVSPASRLELRLAYRKEATAVVGEEALQTALETWRRYMRRELSTLPGDADPHGDTALARLCLGILDRANVEQQGTQVRAAVELKQGAAQLLSEAVRRTGISTRRTQDANNLKQLALGMHNYHDTYLRLPPAAMKSKEGKPLYSWRVLLLPYIEEDNLYRQFKLDEPWDSAHNKALLSRMPKTFAAPTTAKDPPFTTRYQVLVDGGALFESDGRVRLTEIPDGTSNTMMIVEAAAPVPWTKPADLTFSPKAPLPRFGGVFKEGFNVAMADGSIQFIPSDTSAETLRAMITKAGGEIFDWPGTAHSGQKRPADGRIKEVPARPERQPGAPPDKP